MAEQDAAGRALTAATIFVGAFLLFLIQPVIAKIILPWFGGSAAVWTTCMLFFQTALLLGYLYAHWLVGACSPKRQAWVHIGLLALSLLALPLLLRLRWTPQGGADPTVHILSLLLLMIGLPYFMLSATSPLLQAWFALRRGPGEAGRASFPYRLYALSNAGSMLALAGYPFLVEPKLALRVQSWSWAAAYAGFTVLCGAVAWRVRAAAPAADVLQESASSPKPGFKAHVLWLTLAACGSTLLLAVTNHLSQNIAAIPFLWLLPLSLYLLSFIVCFGGKVWRWEKSFLPFPALAIGAMVYAMAAGIDEFSLVQLVIIFCAGLFVCCLFCHGELSRVKPDARWLTSFYLMVSLGGALGGLFVGLLAPRLFRDFYELPLGIAVCALLAWWRLYREPGERWGGPFWLALGALSVGALGFMTKEVRQNVREDRLTVRNFYGVLRVSQSSDVTSDDAKRTLTHGTIMHGEQFLKSERRRWPTSYYGPRSGAALALREAVARGPRKIGVIGLGAGTLAAYGLPGDVFRFYEINPLVPRLAASEFSFLKDSQASIEIAMGDARLSLEREPPEGFDVLAVDAFSSDAIPVHLLTKEAFELYLRHLKEGGVLAVHVSNRYVALEPVVRLAAEVLGLAAMSVRNDDDDARSIASSDWVLVTRRRDFFKDPLLSPAAQTLEGRPGLRLWTDDYSNLYQILK